MATVIQTPRSQIDYSKLGELLAQVLTKHTDAYKSVLPIFLKAKIDREAEETKAKAKKLSEQQSQITELIKAGFFPVSGVRKPEAGEQRVTHPSLGAYRFVPSVKRETGPSMWELWKQAEDEAYRGLGGSAFSGISALEGTYYPEVRKRFGELFTQFYGETPQAQPKSQSNNKEDKSWLPIHKQLGY